MWPQNHMIIELRRIWNQFSVMSIYNVRKNIKLKSDKKPKKMKLKFLFLISFSLSFPKITLTAMLLTKFVSTIWSTMIDRFFVGALFNICHQHWLFFCQSFIANWNGKLIWSQMINAFVSEADFDKVYERAYHTRDPGTYE